MFFDELVFDPESPDRTTLTDARAVYVGRYKESGALDWAGRVCSNCWLDVKDFDVSDDGSAILSANFEDYLESDINIRLNDGGTISFNPVSDRGNVLLVRLCPDP